MTSNLGAAIYSPPFSYFLANQRKLISLYVQYMCQETDTMVDYVNEMIHNNKRKSKKIYIIKKDYSLNKLQSLTCMLIVNVLLLKIHTLH